MPRANMMVRAPTRPSQGAITLRLALGDMARLSRRSVIPRQYTKVINWGNPTTMTVSPRVTVLNAPEFVTNSIDKLKSLQIMRDFGVPVPEFTTTKPDSVDSLWLARTNLRGSGGAGIIPIRKGDEVPNAPLYVQYIKKLAEYRFHVIGGKVVFVQQKKRRRNEEQTKDQKLIRSYANGWVYCPLPKEEMDEALNQAAIGAVAALELDFAAVDIVVDKSTGSPFVLECNTAPGLESPGLIEAYRKGLSDY